MKKSKIQSKIQSYEGVITSDVTSVNTHDNFFCSFFIKVKSEIYSVWAFYGLAEACRIKLKKCTTIKVNGEISEHITYYTYNSDGDIQYVPIIMAEDISILDFNILENGE